MIIGHMTKNGRIVLQAPQAGQGIELVDEQGTQKVLIGKLPDGSYAGKFVGSKLYSSMFQTGAETGNTYIALNPDGTLSAYYNGKQNLGMWAEQNWGNMIFYENGVDAGQLYAASEYDPIFGDTRRRFVVWSKDTGSLRLYGPGIHLDSDKVRLAQDSSSTIYVTGKIWDGLVPVSDNSGYVGYTNQRWNYGGFYILRAYDLQQADACFLETACPLCEKPFVPGDTIVLLVRHIDEDFLGTMTVPIHSGCQGINKVLTREIQETEERYRLKEDGSIETYRAPKLVEQEDEIHRVKEGYDMDEITGQFKKKALVVQVARDGHTAKQTSRGLKFYNDQTGNEVELFAIQDPVEVFPEWPATKDEAVEVVTVKRSKPVMKTISVTIGQAGV